MAGGLGTRLQPFTHILPKPLMPIKNRPIIEHIIDKIKKSKPEKIFITRISVFGLFENKISRLPGSFQKKILNFFSVCDSDKNFDVKRIVKNPYSFL